MKKISDKICKIILICILTICLVSSITSIGINTSAKEIENGSEYTGRLRLYVVEPISRWMNDDRDPYHFGFLDFAFDDILSIPYLENYSDTIIWDGDQAGYGNVNENNIMVMAAVFNPEINKGYSDPPFGRPFDAHYVDAAAGVKPGETSYNIVNGDFTHTVFVEKATATWCPYCPAMSEALYSIYESQDYPFYFIAFVTDQNMVADSYMSQIYNHYSWPTAYFDGGKKVFTQGFSDESYYRTRIESCGIGDVHKLDLSISLEWMGDGILQIELNIQNREMPNVPPNIPIITGSVNGKAGEDHEYTFVSTDLNIDDEVFYYIDWGDDTNSSWIGSFESGENVIMNHTWEEQGSYTIKAKAKDVYNAESDWSDPLVVSMPKNKAVNTPFINFLEQYPHLLQLLSQLLKL